MKKQKIVRILVILLVLGVIGCAAILGINLYVKKSVEKNIVTQEQAKNLKEIDCILVLGAGVWENNTPSHMLNDRLEEGIALYHDKVSDKLLMSGDHGRSDYDEVNVMKQFAIDRDVRSEDIFMDHAGFSTYESMYRAREIFEAEKIVIVTQKYHLYRALYVARQLGIEAYGVASDPRPYVGQMYREAREILARNKDFFTSVIKPKPTYLGDTIPVNGNGNVTNDKELKEKGW